MRFGIVVATLVVTTLVAVSLVESGEVPPKPCALTVLLWPISWLVKRRYPHPVDPTELRRLRLLIRAAATFDVLYLVAWMALLTPVLDVKLWVYSESLDPLVRTVQLAGVVVIALAVVGIWSLWRLCRLQKSRITWIGNAALAAALLGILWIGFAGQLISFDLNY